jgi:hypothetical protein
MENKVKKLRNLIMVGKCLDIVGRFGFESVAAMEGPILEHIQQF